MSNYSVILELYLLNLGFLASLSMFFFKKGGKWNTARFFSLLPFLACAVYLVLLSFGVFIPGSQIWSFRNEFLVVVSAPVSVSSFILTAYALGSHRAPVALCHQDHEIPSSLITAGAYAKIRHPFYTAHLLILFGVFLFSPNLLTLLMFVLGWAMLSYTAIQEEKRFLLSPLGPRYEIYMKQTGRFLPKC